MTPNAAEAWQAALAAENAALYGYGIVGPRLPAPEQATARDCEQAHRTLRDDILTAMQRAGVTAEPAQAAYPPTFPITDATSARRLALRLESDAAAAWRYLMSRAAPSDPARVFTQSALTGSALRAVAWRRMLTPDGPTVPFPGL